VFGNGRGCWVPEWFHPEITEIFKILDEVPFGVHQFGDDFLALLLFIGDTVGDVFGNGIDPQLLLLIVRVLVQTSTRLFSLETRLDSQVESGLLLKTAGASNRITETVSCAGGGVALSEKRENTVDFGLLLHHRLAELVDLVCRVSQSVCVGHVVEELLGVQRSTKK
jgi:hypothetical protein